MSCVTSFVYDERYDSTSSLFSSTESPNNILSTGGCTLGKPIIYVDPNNKTIQSNKSMVHISVSLDPKLLKNLSSTKIPFSN